MEICPQSPHVNLETQPDINLVRNTKGVTTSGAGLAGTKAVELNVVGITHLIQSGTGVPFLAPGLLVALCAQALGLGWIGEVPFVGGGRLATGTAVAFELGDAALKLLQGFHPVPQLKHKVCNCLGIFLGQGNELFSSRASHDGFYGRKMLKLS